MIFLDDGREWRLPGLLYAYDLEEDLRVIMGQFAEVCRRRGLKDNAGKSKVRVLNGEEGLEWEVNVDGICLEHVRACLLIKIFQVQMGKNAIGR